MSKQTEGLIIAGYSKQSEIFAEPFIATVDQTDVELLDILKIKSKHKPYHTIMRILLFVWPCKLKQDVTARLSELRQLRSDEQRSALLTESPPTKLIWKNLNVETYYSYVNRHKSYVKRGFVVFNELVISAVKPRLHQEGRLLSEYRPEQDATEEQIDVHDDSKYSFVETVTYAMKWYPCFDGSKCDDDAWETGLHHHYCHNEHHPEHWGNKPMYWRFIVEALYDMAAMELEKKFKGQEPDNKAMLLQFDPQFLKRFKETGQLEFIEKIIEYTIEAYCRLNKLPIPAAPAPEAAAVPAGSNKPSF
ncbi:hypothetical protein BOX15_Mlig027342g2 [Macrostomum lignano]|uniref:Uncharacterized protein n=1 Tax=Macrostomum lignano TaxID=282301 RepID=A0A267EWX6_9PLAT|nr:hypothetical protein BOX15_Mlig027342g2 [Macrostomum lignano]